MQGLLPEPDAAFAASVFASLGQPSATTSPSDVADAIFCAANDRRGKLRFPAGPDAVALAQLDEHDSRR